MPAQSVDKDVCKKECTSCLSDSHSSTRFKLVTKTWPNTILDGRAFKILAVGSNNLGIYILVNTSGQGVNIEEVIDTMKKTKNQGVGE